MSVGLINLLVNYIFVKIDYKWAEGITYIKMRSITKIFFGPHNRFFKESSMKRSWKLLVTVIWKSNVT